MLKNFLYIITIITVLMESQASADKNCQHIKVLNQAGYTMGFKYTDCNGNQVPAAPIELGGERNIHARLNEVLAAGTWDHFNKWIDKFGYDNVVHDAPHAPAYLICTGTIFNPSCYIRE